MALPNPPDPSPQPSDPRARRPGPIPALRRTVVRPAGTTPDPTDAAFAATRLSTLAHELSTLLDGSLRVLGLAQRSLGRATGEPGDACPETLSRQLATVAAAMTQMAELVRGTTLGMAEGGSAGLRAGFGASASLADAIHHAADVMTPLAEDNRIHLQVDVGPELSELPSGPIYPVVTNAIRNAIESIQRVRDPHGCPGGTISVRAWSEPGKSGRCVMLQVADDGAGLPTKPGSPSGSSAQPYFTLGYTTKAGGSGVGLALSKDVVQQLGGTIELIPREVDPSSGRSGATLKVCYPMPRTGDRPVE